MGLKSKYTTLLWTPETSRLIVNSRELLFYRIIFIFIDCLDYFAEMAKTDEQMGKVKANLLSQKSKIEKRDKIRQMRQQKKFAKDVQKQAKVKKQEERKVAKEEIKMIKKKGEAGIADFNKVQKEPMKKVRECENSI